MRNNILFFMAFFGLLILSVMLELILVHIHAPMKNFWFCLIGLFLVTVPFLLLIKEHK